MTDRELQSLTERISMECFGKAFRHKAYFNRRLRTTGGRYLLGRHDIEINPKHYFQHGTEELIGIIKHELCHYHLHLEGKGYRHSDPEFKHLLQQVGGSRYCQAVGAKRKPEPYRYLYLCSDCGKKYYRKRRMNTQRYVCGICRGKLSLEKYLQPTKKA